MNTTTLPRRLALLIALLVCCTVTGRSQQSLNALFIGNSYTAVNNLPQMVQQVAASMGDQLTWQSNTPGGCTFSQHCNNLSMSLIVSGGWDIVVLQEQSQLPSFPQLQVEAEVFPYAERLVDSVYAHNPCGEPMFYMTWGRKNGDALNADSFPVLGTYEGMDSMLCERYTYMAQQNDASLCPVGRVWRYLRENHTDIELYQRDESHPSVAGSYAAACAFYVMFFHRDPDSITYNAGLPAATAQVIRSAVRNVVYEQLAQWQRPRPQASFGAEHLGGGEVMFTSTSLLADSLTWVFGDGSDSTTTATQATLVHRYTAAGSYTVDLIASRHCMTDTMSIEITVALDSTEGIDNPTATLLVYPNPARERLTVRTDALPATVTLISLDGRVAMRCEMQYLQNVIDVSTLPAGEYILQLETPAGTLSHGVVILR